MSKFSWGAGTVVWDLPDLSAIREAERLAALRRVAIKRRARREAAERPFEVLAEAVAEAREIGLTAPQSVAAFLLDALQAAGFVISKIGA